MNVPSIELTRCCSRIAAGAIVAAMKAGGSHAGEVVEHSRALRLPHLDGDGAGTRNGSAADAVGAAVFDNPTWVNDPTWIKCTAGAARAARHAASHATARSPRRADGSIRAAGQPGAWNAAADHA
jgi:hypothetical protein